LNPASWKIYVNFDGVNFQSTRSVAGSVFQFTPDICGALTYVVGVDSGGNEITAHSNIVRPDDAVNPANVIVLNSDGHGRLTWTLNFPSDWAFNIYCSADGLTWGHSYDGTDSGARSVEECGAAGYFRICQCDWDGVDILPYSNVVHSDGL
ncbi:MAG: hypothetical protein ACREDQ_05340, partial [Limisphaerales bacterium]